MSHPFKLTVELKQHTPIIHFQHDQEGATLRATEVKAKLDRFIWLQQWSDDFEKGSPYLLGGKNASSTELKELKEKFLVQGFRALDYKMSLYASQIRRREIIGNIPLYFGNMSKEDEAKKEKHFVDSENTVVLEIICWDSTLRSIIKKEIPSFFNRTNFGTRQSKGFGSFEVIRINGEKLEFSAPSQYSFSITNRGSHHELSEYIDLFYRAIRSGINLKSGKQQEDKLYSSTLKPLKILKHNSFTNGTNVKSD